jgi:CRP-like cAMP-binding protein
MLAQTSLQPATARPQQVRPAPAAATKSFQSSIELMGAPMPFSRNAEIYGENEPAEYVYKVISGTVRTYKVLNDGRRQIGAFYLPGDVFGLEIGEEHTFSAEAIVDSKVLVVKRSSLVALAARDNEVARQLWAMTAGELQRAQDHIMLLIKTAQERVAGFLLEMAKRSAASSEVDLPMSRQDIADYLGLTIETVSRTLTQLEKGAAIAVPTSRRIVLRNRAALSRLNA